MKIKEYFLDTELACHCGCGTLPDYRSVERLYMLRLMLNCPLQVVSGSRCPAHNDLVGGKVGSIHLPSNVRKGNSFPGGNAFDILLTDWLDLDVLRIAAERCGFRGFGIGENFLHIDDANRGAKMVWRY